MRNLIVPLHMHHQCHSPRRTRHLYRFEIGPACRDAVAKATAVLDANAWIHARAPGMVLRVSITKWFEISIGNGSIRGGGEQNDADGSGRSTSGGGGGGGGGLSGAVRGLGSSTRGLSVQSPQFVVFVIGVEALNGEF